MTQGFMDLKTLDAAGWAGMRALGLPRHYDEGEVIFAERAEAGSLFLVLEGLVEIYKETTPGQELRLAIVEPDALFGEGCLFDGAKRSAMARAFQTGEVLEIPAPAMHAYLGDHRDFALAFYQLLSASQYRIIAELDADLKSAHRRLRNAAL